MSLSHHLNIRVAGKQSRWGDLRTWAHSRVASWPQPVRVEGAAARPAPCAGCSVPEDSTVPPAVSQHTAGCTLSAHEGFMAASSSVPLTLYWAVAFLCCHRDSDLVVSSSTWRLCARCPAHVFPLGGACSRLRGEDFLLGGDAAKGAEERGFCWCSGRVGRHGGDAALSPDGAPRHGGVARNL